METVTIKFMIILKGGSFIRLYKWRQNRTVTKWVKARQRGPAEDGCDAFTAGRMMQLLRVLANRSLLFVSKLPKMPGIGHLGSVKPLMMTC